MRRISAYCFFLCLIMSGCSGQHSGSSEIDIHSIIGSVASVEGASATTRPGRGEYVCAGVAIPDVVSQWVYSEPHVAKELALISNETSALTIVGAMPPLNAARFENVRALTWQIDVPVDDEQNPLGECQEKVSRMLPELARFPRLKYLQLEFPSAGDYSMFATSLCRLPQMSELEHLEIKGGSLLVMGLDAEAVTMKKLKSLIVRGWADWQPCPDDVGLAIVVTSFYWLKGVPLEKLDMEGALLLELDSLRHLSQLKKLTPPIYYRLKDVARSVERLDMSVSELPLDGLERLSLLPDLKELVIQKEDERPVRRILSGRQVDIIIKEEDQCRPRNLRQSDI